MHSKGFEPLRITPVRPERTTLTTRSRMLLCLSVYKIINVNNTEFLNLYK